MDHTAENGSHWRKLVTFGKMGHTGRFPFTKRFRKLRLDFKCNMIFRFVPLENFRQKSNFWKGSPVFKWKFFDGTACSIYGFRKGFYQFQAACDHIFVKEIWLQLPQLARCLPSPPLRMLSLSWPGSWYRNLGTLPVACMSRHRASNVPRIILKWLLNSSIVCAGKIFS